MTLACVWAGVRWASKVPPVPFSVPVVMLVSQVIEPLREATKAKPPELGLVLLQDLHDGAAYDIEVDTTTTGSDENADQIVQYLIRQDAELA